MTRPWTSRRGPAGDCRPAPHRQGPDVFDPATRAYRDARLAKGWTTKAVFRARKRAVAREVFQALAGQCAVPDYSDLRRGRRGKNLTLTAAAMHLGVWPARIGELELELGRRPNELATRYRAWLNAA